MNPLGQLPPSTSPEFSLSKVDWAKIARFAIVNAAAGVVALGPKLLGYTYSIKGTDVTPYVVIVVGALIEAARRFIAGQPKD